MKITFDAILCECGDVTISMLKNGSIKESICLSKELFEKNEVFNVIPLSDEVFFSCNSCINNWSVEKCACGSGEHYSECKGYDVCGYPMQETENMECLIKEYFLN